MSTETTTERTAAPYLLVSKVEGIKDRLVPAKSSTGALAIAAASTWDVVRADAVTVKALARVGIHLEVEKPAEVAQGDLLAGAEGGEG
jgi:hypothetical protein